MKLQLRLSLIISSLIAAMAFGYLYSLYFVERNHLIEVAETARLDALEKFANVCRESFLSRDEIGLFSYIGQLLRSREIASAMFVDPQGRVLMSGDLSLKGAKLADLWIKDVPDRGILRRRRAGESSSGTILEYATALDVHGVRIGFARLAYDPVLMDEQVSRALGQTRGRFIGIAAICLALGLLVAHYTAYAFTLPIRRLTEGVQRIASGDFAAEFDAGRADEVGQLSGEFNRMASRLKELDELKDQFIQTVSHDLRNPLYSIVLSAEYLLEKGNLEESDVKLTRNIQHSATELARMVSDILDVSKMRAGRMVYHKKSVQPQDLAKAARELYQATLKQKKIAFFLDISPTVPPVNADPRMIERVFSNLISNAVKFTPEGGSVTVGTRPSPESSRLTLFVGDTGIGIPAAEIPNVFTKFHQVSQTEAQGDVLSGTGLGLAICKGIVEDHGGRIWVESDPGLGTRFFFTLPLA